MNLNQYFMMKYPFGNNFYIGGTFQYLHSKDKFYSPSFGIYNKNFYADGLNEEFELASIFVEVYL